MITVAFVVFEGFQSMALAAMPVFEYANFSAGERLYDVRVLSADGCSLRASGGLSIGTEAFDERVFDTVIVAGGDSVLEQAPDAVLEYLRATLDQCLDHHQITLERSAGNRALTVGIANFRISLVLQQHFHGLHMAVVAGQHQ